jgi:Fe-S-cluster-containing dehydrogenase component
MPTSLDPDGVTPMNIAKPTKPKPAHQPLLTRSDLLKIAGLTSSAALVTNLITSGPLSAESIQGIGAEAHPHQGSSEHQWHMAIDLSRCIGCSYCVRACQAVNDVSSDEMRWNIVFAERTADGTEFFMNRPCQHCQEAPCVRVCPVGATWVRPDGIVAMDYQRCIGCRYCEVACPYDVRRFNWKLETGPNPYQPQWGEKEVESRPRGVVEKCTFCVHRIDRGLAQGLTPGRDASATPACVAICPVNARVFGDLLDPNSPISQFLQANATFRLREDWGTQPKVHYVQPIKET